MIDQNTDRMWYVIGAVIVGAALIFLMNSTFPALFGTIGETFEDKVGASTEMTDGIRPVMRPNLLVNTDNDQPVYFKDARNPISREMTTEELADGVTKYTILDGRDESYYRFMEASPDNRYDMRSGNYTLSGYIYIPSETTTSIGTRSQYSTQIIPSIWVNDHGNGWNMLDDIPRDEWVFFSDTSELPDEGLGYYTSITTFGDRVAGEVFYTKGLRYEYTS